MDPGSAAHRNGVPAAQAQRGAPLRKRSGVPRAPHRVRGTLDKRCRVDRIATASIRALIALIALVLVALVILIAVSRIIARLVLLRAEVAMVPGPVVCRDPG